MTTSEVEAAAWAEMIYQAVRFANWAAGQGICPVAGEPAEPPDDFLMAFSGATGFDDWEGLDIGARDRLIAAEATAARLQAERDGDVAKAVAEEREACARIVSDMGDGDDVLLGLARREKDRDGAMIHSAAAEVARLAAASIRTRAALQGESDG